MSKKLLLFMILSIAVVAGVFAKGQKTSFSLRDWMGQDKAYKITLITQLTSLFESKDGVFIRLPAEYYVKELDSLAKNMAEDWDDGDLDVGMVHHFKTISIMDGDWDNGQDKIVLAREHMGEEFFELFKKKYPKKYENLINAPR